MIAERTAKMYNPTKGPFAGSFISEDPVRDGSNWYAYGSNNPINRIDPLGLFDNWQEAQAEGASQFQQNMQNSEQPSDKWDSDQVGENITSPGIGVKLPSYEQLFGHYLFEENRTLPMSNIERWRLGDWTAQKKLDFDEGFIQELKISRELEGGGEFSTSFNTNLNLDHIGLLDFLTTTYSNNSKIEVEGQLKGSFGDGFKIVSELNVNITSFGVGMEASGSLQTGPAGTNLDINTKFKLDLSDSFSLNIGSKVSVGSDISMKLTADVGIKTESPQVHVWQMPVTLKMIKTVEKMQKDIDDVISGL